VLGRLAAFATRHPRAVLAAWLVVIAVLAVRGIGVEDRLSTVSVYTDGTPSKRTQDFKVRSFGDQDFLVVLLRGPAAGVERQGRELTRAAGRMPRATGVVSPWSGGDTIGGLRPSPRAAAVIVNLRRMKGDQYSDVFPPLNDVVNRVVRPPVRADISGQPVIATYAQQEAKKGAKRAELLAFPVLAIVLFLVFGSPVAAAIPGIVGGATVQASRGVIDLLIGPVRFDALAPGIAAMIGLALGIDYALLVVSRYREEIAGGGGYGDAAVAAVASAGRAVIFAGVALLLAMLVATQILPGAIALSTAAAVMMASAFSVVAAIFVVPALLVLLGPYLDRFSIYRSAGAGGGGMAALSRRLTRRPILAAALIGGVLLIAGAQAFALDSNPPSPGLLPPDNRGRQMYENVDRALGPGWGGGIEVLVDGGSTPVTTPARLRELARFERAVSRDRGVATVAGVTRIERTTADLRGVPGQLSGISKTLDRGRAGLARLGGGITQARGGAEEMRAGLRAAASGAELLHGGTGQTAIGGRLLADGLRAAATGSRSLLDGMRSARVGAAALQGGSATALAGAGQLADGLAAARSQAPAIPTGARKLETGLRAGGRQLGDLRQPVGIAEDSLAEAWDRLQRMTVGKADPEYLATLQAVGRARGAVTGRDPLTGLKVDPAYDGLASALTDAKHQTQVAADGAAALAAGGDRMVTGLHSLEQGAASLRSGLVSLADGNRRLAAAMGALVGGGGQLAPGLELLASETARLAGGLAEVDAGSGRLARDLRSGGSRSVLLTDGLGRILGAVDAQRRGLPGGGIDVSRINGQSPGFFRSGYFYLSSVDGAPPGERRRASLVVNVDRGGHAARMAIIPRTGPLAAASEATRHRIEDQARRLARSTGTHVLVGGDSPTLQDFNHVMRRAVPKATLALALVTLLVLIPVLRSLLVPLAAVLLNVLTVGATFGVMSLLFDDSLLGGPGYTDTFTLAIIITVIFGLAIDYEVFVLTRIREEYLRTGSAAAAIERGIAGSARVVTGAALIMIAVFVAFSTSGFISMRDVGVALAVAVFIDAFLIRMLALPGIMRMLGERAWWLPRWLDRVLPRIDLEPPAPRAPAAGAR
jgi:RND superfamily putative drug exporter